MCGIAGYAGRHRDFVPDMKLLRAMCDTIVHRGPDGEGVGIVDNVALGMRRLSIIDLEGGSQPIFNEDRSIRVTLNGEIYNYRELRRELETTGHRFRTQSDTEVIVHAYEEFGDSFVNRLNGMFAFALHDSASDRLLLARDHLGIKPLFYAITSEVLVWGSEIKAILASNFVDRSLAPEALVEFLSWEYVPGTDTLFREIGKLLPGHMLIASSRGEIQGPKPFWDIPTDRERLDLSESDWLERIDDAITTAVRRQLVSDVPLGAFLSGGVDSSLVVGAMGRAQTFSIGFDDPTYNELPFSQEVADHLGTTHSTRLIKPHVADLFDHLMHFMDDPIGDFSIFPTFLVSKLAREAVTVSLSGDGGDELFGGYDTYQAQRLAGQYDKLPELFRSLVGAASKHLPPTEKKKGLINKIKRFVEGHEHSRELRHTRWRLFMSEALQDSLLTREFRSLVTKDAGQHIINLYNNAGNLDGVNRDLYVDAKSYMVDNCLVKVDRMSMAVSLEVRVPLLDVDLVGQAFAIPGHLKIFKGESKHLLKRLAAKKVPHACVYRPKEGFSIPIKNWLGGQFRPFLDEYTNPAAIRADGIFESEVVSRLKSEHLAGHANHSHLLWSLIVFQAWKERWLDG